MQKNARSLIILGLIIAIISSITTYAWNHQTLDEMVEQTNREAIISCLTEARTKETSQAILQATTDCNSHLFTTVSSPLISEMLISTGSEIRCPELYFSGGQIESPRIGVTFYFSEKEVKELYPKCKITSTWTVNLTPVSEVPIWIQLIPKASASDILVEQKNVKNVKNTILNENIVPVRTPYQIYQQVKHLGYREAPTVALVKSCKEGSLNPQKCILVWLTLLYNESGNMQNSKACITRNNCFGVQSGKKVYSSLSEGTDNWVVKYNKYWYKAQSAGFFYSSAGNVSPSRYCTSEDSSNSAMGCPHWLAIATGKWKKLYPIIY